jgi:hypothetical protein
MHDNERPLFTSMARQEKGKTFEARLIVEPSAGQLSTITPSGSYYEDFISRYPLGWQICHPELDHLSEHEVLRNLARSNSLDKQSRFLFEQSLSLRDLLAKRGGRNRTIIAGDQPQMTLPLRVVR